MGALESCDLVAMQGAMQGEACVAAGGEDGMKAWGEENQEAAGTLEAKMGECMPQGPPHGPPGNQNLFLLSHIFSTYLIQENMFFEGITTREA